MFVCEVCIEKYEGIAVNLAVASRRRSIGPCEVCGTTRSCYDIPSSAPWRLKEESASDWRGIAESKRFTLEHSEVPAAYIDLVEDRNPADSVRQVVVELEALKFQVKELIFDLDAGGQVVGVELL